MSKSIAVQTRTAVIGVVAGFVLGASGIATAATISGHEAAAPTSCSLTRHDAVKALRVIAASDTAARGVDNSYPALKSDAQLARITLAAHSC